MSSNVQLVLLVLVTLLSMKYLTLACNIETARATAKRPGGWSGVAVDHQNVVQLKQSVVNDATVVKAHRVIESYQQAMECVVGGHQSLHGQHVQRTSISCKPMKSCNIELTRQSAKHTLPGGWHEEATNSKSIAQLLDDATKVANVRHGVVQEAYAQTVAGFNYCIQFDSIGAANCHRDCQPLKCVAAGHLPVDHATNNPGVVSAIGVHCQPGGKLLGFTVMEIQMLLMLMAASWMCCEALDRKSQAYRRLLKDYEKEVDPPLPQGVSNTVVKMLLQARCVSTIHEYILVEGVMLLSWVDDRLRWDPADYRGLYTLHVNSSVIWTPDLKLHFSVKTELAEAKAVVVHNGTVYWFPPAVYAIRCPKDHSGNYDCTLTFSLWTYTIDELDVAGFEFGSALNLEEYLHSCPLAVKSHNVERKVHVAEFDPSLRFREMVMKLKLAKR